MESDRLVSSHQTGFVVEPPERVMFAQKPHFLNAVKYFPGKFSCAADCFLEVWLRVICHLIPEPGGSEFLRLLHVLRINYEHTAERLE